MVEAGLWSGVLGLDLGSSLCFVHLGNSAHSRALEQSTRVTEIPVATGYELATKYNSVIA